MRTMMAVIFDAWR